MVDAFFIFSAKYLFVLPIILLVIYFILQPRSRWFRMAVFAFASLAVAYLLGRLAGYLYFDPRPFVVGNFTPLVSHAPNNGFPSDHTLLVSAIAMIGTFWNRRLGLWLWFIAVVVALARVYVGVHHPIDVIGSMVIALVATSIIIFVSRNIRY